MLSRPRKPPAKMFLPSGSLRLTHQVKLISSFWKTELEEAEVAAAAAQPLVVLIHEPHGEGMDRRADVAEVVFVRRDLAVRVQVMMAQEQHELPLGELEVDQGQGDGMERQVPGRVPGILPLVGHGDDVRVVHVEPVGIANVARIPSSGLSPWSRSHWATS